MRPTIDELSTAAHACPAVSSVIALAQTPSTNTVGLDAAREGAPDFTVIVTAHQQAGRGRHDRVWESPAGSSLTFSVLLRPTSDPQSWGHLPLMAGLAVCDGLSAVLGEHAASTAPAAIGLKWPNDVLINGQKVSGVLLETHIADAQANPANGVVVGIGINIDWRGLERPEAFRDRATSLAEWMDADIDAGAVLTAVLTALHHLWITVGHDPDGCIALVRERCSTIGRSVTAHGEQPVTGTAIGLTPQGHLVIMPDTVNSNDNTPVVVRAADVEHLR